MTRKGKTKKCADCKPPKTDPQYVSDILQTQSSVCHQSLDMLSRMPIRGVFNTTKHKPAPLDTGWFTE